MRGDFGLHEFHDVERSLSRPASQNFAAKQRSQAYPHDQLANCLFKIWPRNSPSLCATVWMIKYIGPPARAVACTSVRNASPLIGLATLPESGTTGGAFAVAAPCTSQS